MAYTAPSTKSAGDLLTAADWNTYIRDNQLADAVAQVTTAGDLVVASGNKALVRAPRGEITQGVGVRRVLSLGSTQTVNNSSTFVDIPDIVVPVLSGEIWHLRYYFLYITGTTPDIKFGIKAGPVGLQMYLSMGISTAGAAQYLTGLTLPMTAQGSIAGANTWALFEVFAEMSSSGDVIAQFAQAAATASNTQLLVGTTVEALRLKA